jgi:hypothetical protein
MYCFGTTIWSTGRKYSSFSPDDAYDKKAGDEERDPLVGDGPEQNGEMELGLGSPSFKSSGISKASDSMSHRWFGSPKKPTKS